MGNTCSSSNSERQQSSSRPRDDSGPQSRAPPQPAAAPAQETPKPATLDKKYEIVISGTSLDKDEMQYIQRKLEILEYAVFANLEGSSEKDKLAGKALVDTKLLISIASSNTAKCKTCADQVSLAYISNTPILVAGVGDRAKVLNDMPVGLKLTLEGLPWFDFTNLTQSEDSFDKLKVETEKYVPATKGAVSVPVIRQERVAPDDKGDGGDTWAEMCGEGESASWTTLSQIIEEKYISQLDSKMQPLVRRKVFESVVEDGKVTKSKFHSVCPPGKDFIRIFTSLAMSDWAIQEVFSMESSVRLASIENLGKIQSPAIISALLKLLRDKDPNIRAVAAISLGRTETADEGLIDTLIELLEDKDRIVRQSACLSLGRLKATKAVPMISHIWRNDFISTVREAAHAALGQIGGPEAEKVLRVTDILQKEIAYLATTS